MAEATLSAVVNRILPSDGSPGALETATADYVEQTLGEPFFQRLQAPFEGSLRLLDEIAQGDYGRSFAACSEDEQDTLLRDVQAQRHDSPQIPASGFFEILITMALEGYLCNPERGGNRYRLGWLHMGFDPSKFSPPPSADVTRTPGQDALPEAVTSLGAWCQSTRDLS